MAKNLNAVPAHELQVMSIVGDGDNSDLQLQDSPVTNESTAPPPPPPVTEPTAPPTTSGRDFTMNNYLIRQHQARMAAQAAQAAASATPPVVMMTAIMPRVFIGLESEDPREWLDHYELICKSNNWSNDMKMNRVVTALAGHALTWYMSWIRDHLVPSWASFCGDLLLTFGVQKP